MVALKGEKYKRCGGVLDWNKLSTNVGDQSYLQGGADIIYLILSGMTRQKRTC